MKTLMKVGVENSSIYIISMNKFGCKLFGFLVFKCFYINTTLRNMNGLD